jgi:hypothetical protein
LLIVSNPPAIKAALNSASFNACLAFAPRCSLCCRIRELTSVNRKTAARRSLRSVVLSGGRCLYLPFLTPFHQSQSGKAGGEERQRPGQRNGRRNAGSLDASFCPKGKQRTSHSICCRQTCDAKKECSRLVDERIVRAVPSDGTVGVSINPAWSRWSDDESSRAHKSKRI